MKATFPLALTLVLAAGTALAQGSGSYPPMGPPQGMRGQGMMMNMDTNNDGTVSRDEFMAGHQQADERFARMDSNKDGSISRDEWMAQAPQGPNAADRFRQLDTNGDGKISHTELEARRTARFDSMDTNRDGQLSANELPQRGGPRGP
jgi:Ca2+-binding EF-hand superfamily protein